MEQKIIGKFIASLRKANGYTQEELGEILGVSNKTISSWENGNSNPDLAILPVIADLFNVTCDELLRGEKIKDKLIDVNKGERIRKNLLKNIINKYLNMTYISMGIFFASLCLIIVGIIYNFYVFGIILLVIGIIIYLGGIVFSIITYNDAKNRVSDDENNKEYYRILLNKSLQIKCIYSFFILTPLFCYYKDKKLLNDSKYDINEEEEKIIKYNLKLKKIFYRISMCLILLCSLGVIIVELIPEPYFSNEKYTLEQIKESEYTFDIEIEDGFLTISNAGGYNNFFLNMNELIVNSINEGKYTFDLFIGDYDDINSIEDFYHTQNGITFYIDYSLDYESVKIIYSEKVLIELTLSITNRGTAYYNGTSTSYYEIVDGIFTKEPGYNYSLKDDLQGPIVLFSILLIMIDIGIYFIKKDKTKI